MKIRSDEVLGRWAVFSDCDRYRYLLRIVWDKSLPRLCFLMLNPSTANETQNDPTIERCQRRAEQYGYGGLSILNAFAFRATDPADMKREDDPVGELNDRFIVGEASRVPEVVLGWGSHGTHRRRDRQVLELLWHARVRMSALRVSKDGTPWHPLYLPYDATPQPYVWNPGPDQPTREIEADERTSDVLANLIDLDRRIQFWTSDRLF